MFKEYHVSKTAIAPTLTGQWDGNIWGDVDEIDVKCFMGHEPEHKPKTQAKVLYDDDSIYVIFRVEDEYIRATAKKHQDCVCCDSCVEFFFAAGENGSRGYFNIEINCGGTMLFHHQLESRKDNNPVSNADCQKIAMYHSEPKTIDPEKQQPTIWFIEYRLPLEILEKYAKVVRPAPGVIWRANFYKCADKTSRPHWLTWSAVDIPMPDFHRPDFFGTLKFT